MNKLPVILIFDVGKTNKKILLFDEQYNLLYEESDQFEEIKDEDGFPCDDIQLLTKWLKDSYERIKSDNRFEIKAVNFSGYGASFVHVNNDNTVSLPLYNYLKPFPDHLRQQFYDKYGGENFVSRKTASPVLGNLNSGLQLYRLKYEKPDAFARIKYALHLPQYLSYVLAQNAVSDITSIGCHTMLWDFDKKKYHKWVNEERILEKLAPVVNADSIAGYLDKSIPVGTGIHDSSSALIPYLASFRESFILLSTGTWSISLNPFNNIPLTDDELKQDCLCYLSYKGEPVKASRLFAGHEHEEQVKRLSAHFDKDTDYFKTVQYNEQAFKVLHNATNQNPDLNIPGESDFGKRDLNEYSNYEEAYHQLIVDIVRQQKISTQLVLNGTDVRKIFVDGGFGKNDVYMRLLAKEFKSIEVYAASVPQASAIGAAMAIHSYWNQRPLSNDIVGLKLVTSL